MTTNTNQANGSTPRHAQEQVSDRTQVLVVGGALTGLSAAVFLAHQGVQVTMIERHPDVLLHPRLRGVTPRTMETFRQVGLEAEIKAQAFADGEKVSFVPIQAETLADEQYVLPEDAEGDESEIADPLAFGPTGLGMIDQDKLELVLRDRARELGADLRYATALVSYEENERNEQNNPAITAILEERGTGTRHTITADYLIAADGSGSSIREGLGIETDGPGVLFTTITAVVRADLNAATRGRQAALAYLQKPRPFSFLMPHNEDGTEWVFGTGHDPESEPVESFTDEQIADMVRAAAGLEDIEVELKPQIPGTDIKVMAFPVGARVARTYRSGRVFLAGDAARIQPPTGGFGGSTGVQDVHNLAWKLAAVLKGYAGIELLDTYDAERQPYGVLAMEQAFSRFGDRMAGGAQVERLDYAAVTVGYRYSSDAVVGAEKDLSPLPPSRLDGRPGTRAPHRTLPDGSSTLDRYGTAFVVLAGRAFATPEFRGDVPVETHTLDADLEAAHGIGESGALLVRPDGFVAWRGESPNALQEAVRTIIAR